MDLKEIDDFRKSLEKCPDCGSTEGFWLLAKREKTYFQCKHCAAILEICKVPESPKTSKNLGNVFTRLKS